MPSFATTCSPGLQNNLQGRGYRNNIFHTPGRPAISPRRPSNSATRPARHPVRALRPVGWAQPSLLRMGGQGMFVPQPATSATRVTLVAGSCRVRGHSAAGDGRNSSRIRCEPLRPTDTFRQPATRPAISRRAPCPGRRRVQLESHPLRAASPYRSGPTHLRPPATGATRVAPVAGRFALSVRAHSPPTAGDGCNSSLTRCGPLRPIGPAPLTSDRRRRVQLESHPLRAASPYPLRAASPYRSATGATRVAPVAGLFALLAWAQPSLAARCAGRRRAHPFRLGPSHFWPHVLAGELELE